jgi:hypothetical protein
LHGFVCGLSALPTQRVIAPNVQFLRIEKETRTNYLANTRIEGNTRIQTYEDQERERRTGYDGHTITYSDWTAIRTWEKRQTQSSRTETQIVCVNENRQTIFQTEKCGGRRYVLFGPCDTQQVQCGETVTKQMQEKSRQIITDFDGNISYGNWKVIREWTS